jgi:uncharacterized membrane protein YbhN (UPF0104 family)
MSVLDAAIAPGDTVIGPADTELAATLSALSFEPGEDLLGLTRDPSQTDDPRTSRKSRRLPRLARIVTTLAVAGLGTDVLLGHRHQLGAGLGLIGHASAWWLLVAAATETASVLSFGLVQQRLLRSRSATMSLRDVLQIAVAANGIANVLPGGSALAAAWTWKQFRSRGASRSVASWALIVAGVVSSVALGFMIIAGTEIAGGRGPLAFLRPLAAGVAAAAVGGGLLAYTLRDRADSWTKGRHRLSGIRAAAALSEPTPSDWAIVTVMSVLNWALDLACLIACIAAIGTPVAWTTILVAYSLSQLLNAIPLTPGGLGIIEAGLTALLVAYGMATADAIATVLIYRATSYWIPTPIGLTIWIRMHLRPDTAEPQPLYSQA